MKQINIVIIDNEEFDTLIDSKLNSLIKFNKNDNKYYFHSHYKKEREEIKINKRRLLSEDFNEKMYKMLNHFIRPSLEKSASISNEPIDLSNIDGLTRVTFSIITKYSFINLSSIDIFDFFTDIFISFLNGHILKNGNKRFSLLFLINVTYFFGWYFKFSQGGWINYSNHKNIVEIFTEKLENLGSGMFDFNNNVRLEIKEWIKNNLVIACKF